MKKLTKVAALFAASALAFGGLFLSCSSDGLPPELRDDTTPADSQNVAETPTTPATTPSTPTDDKGPSVNQNSDYTLDITKIPETTGATNKLDDTVTVVSTKKNNSGTAQTIKYSSNGYVQMSGAGVSTEYGLKLTLSAAATIKVKATKKSNGTATAVKLLDSSGNAAGATSGIDANGATSLTEYSISNVAAGTYYLGADSNGCFLFSLVIDY